MTLFFPSKKPQTFPDKLLDQIDLLEEKIITANLRAIEAQMDLEELIAKKSYLETYRKQVIAYS